MAEIALSICVKKYFSYELIFVLLSKLWRILSNFLKITEKSYIFFDE